MNRHQRSVTKYRRYLNEEKLRLQCFPDVKIANRQDWRKVIRTLKKISKAAHVVAGHINRLAIDVKALGPDAIEKLLREKSDHATAS